MIEHLSTCHTAQTALWSPVPRRSQRKLSTASENHPGQSSAARGGTRSPKEEPMLAGVRGCRKETGLCSHAIQHGALMEPQQQRHHGQGRRPAQGRGRRAASALAHEVRPLQLLTSRGEDRQVNSAGVTSLYLL